MLWLAVIAVWAWFSVTTDRPLFTFFVFPTLLCVLVPLAVVVALLNRLGAGAAEAGDFFAESEDRFYGDSE